MAATIDQSTTQQQPVQEKQPYHLTHPRLHAMWRGFVMSVYVTNIWEWFLSLATRAVQPVLFGTVMYNIAMTYPGMQSPGLGWDVAAFLIQNGALDIASFGLPGLARQARAEGNETGAAEAEILGNRLFKIMVANLVWGGVEHILTGIKDAAFTTLLGNIALIIGLVFVVIRSFYAIRYSVVIHGLKASSPVQQEEQATQQGTQIADLKAQVHTIAESLHKLVEATQNPVHQVHTGVDLEQFERLASIVYSMQTSVTEVNQNVLSITQNLYTTQGTHNGYTGTQEATQAYTPIVDQGIHLDGVDTLKSLGMPVLDVPGVSVEKVSQVIAAYLSGTAWREMPGNYSKTIKPIRDAYLPYVDQGTQRCVGSPQATQI